MTQQTPDERAIDDLLAAFQLACITAHTAQNAPNPDEALISRTAMDRAIQRNELRARLRAARSSGETATADDPTNDVLIHALLDLVVDANRGQRAEEYRAAYDAVRDRMSSSAVGEDEQHALTQAFIAFDRSPQTRSLADTIGALITRARGGYCRDADCTCASQLGFRACASPSGSPVPASSFGKPVSQEAPLSSSGSPRLSEEERFTVEHVRGFARGDSSSWAGWTRSLVAIIDRLSVASPEGRHP